jgi:hypothetical protein
MQIMLLPNMQNMLLRLLPQWQLDLVNLFRLQIYEFLHTLAQGGLQSQLSNSNMHLSNGEDEGAGATGLGVLLSPMKKVLDEMYSAQDL